VLLTDRGEHAFDALVLATGSVPVGLPGNGGQRFLRTIDDARALRDALAARHPAGGGRRRVDRRRARDPPARARGCQVTVVEAAASPLAGALGPRWDR
jgi:NADPH-dependent 2,4-dienoyl-CoA reductase/sulfur reductase-like enzyme